MGVYQQWTNLTPSEKAFIATHPQYALTIRNSKDTAYNETKRVMGRNGRNDASDAFRHCFWSSILSRDMGALNAWWFTTAHETGPSVVPAEKTMDLHNNRVGIKIGNAPITGGVPGVSSWFNSNAELSKQCKAALDGGKLQTSP